MMTTYYEKNKEKILKRQKLYFENNREKVLKQKREWARKHRTELREKGLMPLTKKQLEKENKQLKSILTELEEHLEKEWNITSKSPKGSFYEGYDTCMLEMKKDIQNKIQKLKEKYK